MTASLTERAEAAIRRLPDVEGVSVQVMGEEIREVHVLSNGERPAKGLVRNIVTALRAGVGVTIDHRIVSIAQQSPNPPHAVDPLDRAPAASAVRAAEKEQASDDAARDDRIRFESVNLFVS